MSWFCLKSEVYTVSELLMWPSDKTVLAQHLQQQLATGPVTGWQAEIPPPPQLLSPQPAAVLIPLVWSATEPVILLTRRGDSLPTHAGQVSFPGGKLEAQDQGAIDAALREAEEEIGLARSAVTVLGTLPALLTITGFSVVPVVGLIEPPLALIPSPDEVAEIFSLPLACALKPGAYQRQPVERGGRQSHYLVLDYPGYHIWGVTAAMLRMLSLTLGRS